MHTLPTCMRLTTLKTTIFEGKRFWKRGGLEKMIPLGFLLKKGLISKNLMAFIEEVERKQSLC